MGMPEESPCVLVTRVTAPTVLCHGRVHKPGGVPSAERANLSPAHRYPAHRAHGRAGRFAVGPGGREARLLRVNHPVRPAAAPLPRPGVHAVRVGILVFDQVEVLDACALSPTTPWPTTRPWTWSWSPAG